MPKNKMRYPFKRRIADFYPRIAGELIGEIERLPDQV
jgi:hypothetical protein